MRRVRREDSAAGGAAETVLQLAVLLQSGVAPSRAWAHLADTGDESAARVVTAMADGAPLADAIARAGAPPPPPTGPLRALGVGRRIRAEEAATDAWPEVAAAWRVAIAVGAPLADSLRGMATALRDAGEAADDVRVALAEPAGTARLMGWLPLVAVALGAALGFDTVGVLVSQPLGIACLIGGGVLIMAAQRWTKKLVVRAQPDPTIPGHRAELMAIALSGGVSIERATALVEAAGASPDAPIDDVLRLSRTAGVPAVELLRASAVLARHRGRIDGRLRAARLSSRLLLPLGVCTLPAFLLLGVAPMMLGVMSAVPLSL